jgi:hypothetical protein
MSFFRDDPTPEEMQQQLERAKAEREIAEQRALVAEAKKRYGKDWSKMFSNFSGGIDWQKLKFNVGSRG